MSLCPKCGSGSRDRDRFCGGCGARWPEPKLDHGLEKQSSAFTKLPAQIGSMGLEEVRPKRVWLAVSMALLLGPLGMAYSTVPGTFVMLVVGVVLQIWLGWWSYLIVPPICAVWAWWAVREYASVFD